MNSFDQRRRTPPDANRSILLLYQPQRLTRIGCAMLTKRSSATTRRPLPMSLLILEPTAVDEFETAAQWLQTGSLKQQLYFYLHDRRSHSHIACIAVIGSIWLATGVLRATALSWLVISTAPSLTKEAEAGLAWCSAFWRAISRPRKGHPLSTASEHAKSTIEDSSSYLSENPSEQIHARITIEAYSIAKSEPRKIM